MVAVAASYRLVEDWPLTVSISVNDVRLRGLLYAVRLTLRLTVAERRSPAGVVVEVVASAAFIPNLGSGESEVDSTIRSAGATEFLTLGKSGTVLSDPRSAG